MRLFKQMIRAWLLLHALADLALAAILYRQTGLLIVSVFPIVICGVFSLPLDRAVRDEEFHWRSFRRAGPIDLSLNPIAFWLTFAVLALFHLFITAQLAAASYDMRAPAEARKVLAIILGHPDGLKCYCES